MSKLEMRLLRTIQIMLAFTFIGLAILSITNTIVFLVQLFTAALLVSAAVVWESEK